MALRRAFGGIAAASSRRGSRLLDSIERRLGITPTGLTLIVLCVVGLVVGRIIASRALYLFVYGALATLGLAWVIARRGPSVDAERSSLPSRVREGQIVEATVALTAKRRVATIILEEEMPEQFGLPRRTAVPLLSAGERMEHPYTFAPSLRGVYQVGPLVAQWSDPFGLTRRRQKLLDPVTVVVHPTVEPVNDRIVSRAWEDPPIRPPVSKPWPTGFEFYGMRDYVHGDDPRRIVWRAVARSMDLDDAEFDTTRYLVWEAEQGITDEVELLVNTDRDAHSKGNPSATLEATVRAAASLGVMHLEAGFSVSLSLNGRTLDTPMRGRANQVLLLDHLARVESEAVRYTKNVERLFLAAKRARHNILITPTLDQTTAGRLRLLIERGTSMLLVLVMTEDTDPMTVHRAGSLGCNVVELRVGMPFSGAFTQVVAGARR
ncbi:MAG TPA: DUF58 domain-containing protein [Egibacteraceae bacterium]|nr:DUF58 domain-containing protein [Egibacteraceae bacterium]